MQLLDGAIGGMAVSVEKVDGEFVLDITRRRTGVVSIALPQSHNSGVDVSKFAHKETLVSNHGERQEPEC